MKRIVAVVCLVVTASAFPVARQSSMPDDAAIKAILANRIDVEKRNVGIVVGIVEPAGSRVVAHGTFGVSDPRPVGADTVFEIGSITKVFTSLLLTDMVERGEVKLDDPVAQFLRAGVKVPERDGRSITLQDLSTHTSALPRLPGNIAIKNPGNPYADYSVEDLYSFLSGYTLPRAVGERFEYSNLGVGLLGHALALRAGADYESVLRARLLTPLGMNDTAIALSPELRGRLAQGHSAQRLPVANWDIPTLAGAGALRSTTNDMVKFLKAFVSGHAGGLAPAMARMRSVERPGAAPNTSAALGWQVVKRPDSEVVWHNGGTGGYMSFVGFVPARGVGVVVLSNMQLLPMGVDDVGMHLLDSRVPLSKPPVQRTRVTLPADALKAFVGRYELAPGLINTVTQEGDKLFIQLTNQPRAEVFPQGPRSFFLTIVDAQFDFEVDAGGRATSVTLTQGAMKLTGPRLPEP